MVDTKDLHQCNYANVQVGLTKTLEYKSEKKLFIADTQKIKKTKYLNNSAL